MVKDGATEEDVQQEQENMLEVVSTIYMIFYRPTEHAQKPEVRGHSVTMFNTPAAASYTKPGPLQPVAWTGTLLKNLFLDRQINYEEFSIFTSLN